jgi:prepilin-type N-terminal cleavage/methylation domain-containing protein
MNSIFRLNQKGFSIAELMIATAIWSVVALGTGYGVVQVQKSQQEMSSKNETLSMKKNLSSYFKSGMLCEDLLRNRNLPNVSNNDYTDLGTARVEEFNRLLTETDSAVTVRKARVDRVQYRVKANSIDGVGDPFKTTQVGPVTQRVKTVEFEVGFSYLKPGASPTNTTFDDGAYTPAPPLIFEAPVYTDTADRFISCSQDMNMTEMCSSLGFVLDPATQRCTASGDMCVFGDVFAFSTIIDGGVAAQINAAILAGGVAAIEGDNRTRRLSRLLRKKPTDEDIRDILDLPTYEGEIKVSCVTPTANSGLGCQCQPGFEAREAGFFTKNRNVSCGKKCSTTFNVRVRSFMCIKCDE